MKYLKEYIEQIDTISYVCKDSKLMEDIIMGVDNDSEDISEFLGIKNLELMIFCILFVRAIERKRTDLLDIADYTGCRIMEMLDVIEVLDNLTLKKLIYKERTKKGYNDMDFLYWVPYNVIESIMNGIKPQLTTNKKADMYDLLESVNEHIELRDDGFLSYADLIRETEAFIEQNKTMKFVKALNSLNLQCEEKLLLLYMCRHMVTEDREVSLSRAISKVMENQKSQISMKRRILQGRTKLQKDKLISLEKGYFRSDKAIMLSDKAIRMLFEKDSDLYIEDNSYSNKNLIPSNSITEKQLYYDDRIRNDINFITDLLKPDNFERVQKRLADNKLKKGLIILFHSLAAGTGKTETALQIAKKTKRDIITLEVTDFKNLYYGESERLLKSYFEHYQRIASKCKIQPILLLNECDQIIGKRRELSNSSISQTENAIQSILLNEMELFNGIMICTCNITYNLDEAFDRRFHYKICFNKPDLTTRIKIWSEKIPQLDLKDAEYLAGNFDFSGGQIDNVARKCLLKSVLKNKQPDLNELRRFCEQENVIVKHNKIGFNIQ